MAHSLNALRPTLALWDRQGRLPVGSSEIWQHLDLDLPFPCRTVPEGWFAVSAPAPPEEDLQARRDLLDSWRMRLHYASILVWWPGDETLYEAVCQFNLWHLERQEGQLVIGRFWLGEGRGSLLRVHVPARLQPHLSIIAAFELDPDAESIYRDWCLEHDWLERFPVPVARTPA
jgi:hypothetical protein